MDANETDISLLSRNNGSSKMAVRHNTEVYTRQENHVGRVLSVPGQRLAAETNTAATRESLSRHVSYAKNIPGTKTDVQKVDKPDGYLYSTLQQSDRMKMQNSIVERSVNTLERHKTRLNILNTEGDTVAFRAALETLQDRRSVCITGRLGSGKTFTALNLMSTFLEENYDLKPYILHSPFELEHLKNTSTCVVVLADNFIVQRIGSQERTLHIWARMIKSISSHIERRRIRFIFTTDIRDIYSKTEDELLMNTLINVNNTHDLDDETLTLSNIDRNKILTLCSKHFNKPLFSSPKHIASLAHRKHDGVTGFPLCCSMIGISGSEEIFIDAFQSLCGFITDIREHQLPSFVLMILVLILNDNCTLNNLRHEQLCTFKNVLDVLQNSDCSLSDIATGLVKLKRQNILSEDEMGIISFTHEIHYHCLLYVISQEFMADILPMLSIIDINTILYLPETVLSNESHDKTNIINVIKSSPGLLSKVASRVNDILEARATQDFMLLALSPLWSLQAFMDTILSMFGYQFFFVTDAVKLPLCAYFVRTNNIRIIYTLINFMSSMPTIALKTIRAPIQRALEEACLLCDDDLVRGLMTLLPNPDASVINATIEGGSVKILNNVWSKVTDTFRRVPLEMIQFACQYGNLEIVKYLLDYMDICSEKISKPTLIRRRNREGESLLHYAARGGCVAMFEYLVEQRCDPTQCSANGRNILHTAAEYGQFQMVRYLCSTYPYFVGEKDCKGLTCAHLAAREGHADILQVILNHESHIAHLTEWDNTPFHFAVFNGHVEICMYLLTLDPELLLRRNTSSLLPVQLAARNGKTNVLKFLIERGSDICTKTVDGRTLVHLATYHGHLDTVKYLCSHYPKLVKEYDIHGNTVVHDAAASGDLQILQYLQAVGENPLAQNDEGTTTLHDACFHGKLEMAKFLCNTYPQLLNSTNKNGYSPCFGAALGGHVDILKFLVNEGADPTKQSEDGSTPLHEAAFGGKQEVVNYLTTAFPDMVEIMNNAGYLACHFAAQEGYLDILMKLMSYSEQPPKTKDEQTLLHISAYNGSLLVTKFLSQAFPSLLETSDKYGSLPIHYAARSGNIEMFNYFVEQGQDPEACTASGSTSLHLAAFDGNITMVTYLCDKYPQLTQVLDSNGHNAAHFAAGSGEIPVLLNILERNVNPLIRSENGSTLLLKAAFGGRIEMTKYLCTQFPSLLSMTDEFGCNILHYAACGTNSIDVIRYAVEQGVDSKSQANDGYTMLHIAAYHDKYEVVKYICEEFPFLLYTPDYSGNTPDVSAVNGGSKQVIQYFNMFRKSNNVSAYDSSTMMSDVCCYTGHCCSPRRMCETIAGIMCFCRRANKNVTN